MSPGVSVRPPISLRTRSPVSPCRRRDHPLPRPGSPSFARRRGPFPEIVGLAQGGLLFSTAEELRAAIWRLQHDCGERRRLARNAYSAYRKHWTEAPCCSVTLRSCAERPSAAGPAGCWTHWDRREALAASGSRAKGRREEPPMPGAEDAAERKIGAHLWREQTAEERHAPEIVHVDALERERIAA
jgi:hypothetical protein